MSKDVQIEATRTGERVDSSPLTSQIDFSRFSMRVSTERYWSPEHQARERERLWMRVWQIAARAEDIPEPGDWSLFSIYDQSYVLVRGRDGKVRGFVNACRHRGNAFCQGKSGHASRFTCPYHNWSYGLDGQLLAVAKPDYDGSTEEFVGAKEELGLIEASVEEFAGFVFLNPEPGAAPLAEFLGEVAGLLVPYRLEEMVPLGMYVREAIDCNWKVVMDAFQEGYHVQGVHPQLAGMVKMSREHCNFFGDHAVTFVPFGSPELTELGPDKELEGYLGLPVENFPGFAEAFPRLAEIADGHRGADGRLNLPDGVTPLSLFQQAVREVLTAKGLDVSGLTDNQMSDYQYWLLFPNVFMQVRAGDATVIIAEPHASGDPNRCHWRAIALMWLPPEKRAEQRIGLTEIAEDDHFPYFLALQQDFEQMAIQQKGLRNRALEYQVLTRQEPKVVHLHGSIDSWLDE
jgi:phenylpropionate dioxygenase-like ring-hydroxylating dioxygenase large terminal subunit